jgi:flavin reductase (DIM6/NTAB) family NADH-FMN oxidoreductase RutF
LKKEYSEKPPSMADMETYGFSWMGFVTAIPSPLFVVTSYKSNGKPNACLQSWACFNGEPDKFFAILSCVSKSGHMYETVHETGVAVLNFPSAGVYDQCAKTIINNDFDDDEITLSGLTAEPASKVNAPRIKECFLSLESRFAWEREITEGSPHVVMCFEIVNICIDEAYLDESSRGRYGESGYLYNVHYPVDPETFSGKSHDYLAVLRKLRDMGEY